jgi:hypothetical protein
MSDSDVQITFSADTSNLTGAFGDASRSLQQLSAQVAQFSNNASVSADKAATKFEQSWNRSVTGVTQTFSSGLIKMAEGHESFAKVMGATGNKILTDFVDGVVDKKVEAWITGESMQLMASQAGQATLDALGLQSAARDALIEQAKTTQALQGASLRTAAAVGGATATSAAEGQSAMLSIGTSAGKAAAGVYADVATSFGPAGPFVAPVLAGAALAAVLDFKGLVSSAEGGFDIPTGVNPLTQLHQEEMVLPARFANPLRDVLNSFSPSGANGGGGANDTGGDTHLHMHMGAGSDGPSLQRWFDQHGDKLTKTLAAQTRKGAKFT